MKYDMDRITGEFPFQSESDLKQHFHMLDIEGTI